jgi:hypothetical protein
MPLFHNKKTFLKAAQTGNTEEIWHCIVFKIPDSFSINVQDEKGMSAVHHAARAGNTEMLNMLLRRVADPNLADKDGVTPLMMAVQDGKSAAAVMLIANGANPDTHSSDYVYPLHLAAFAGDLDVVNALVGAHADLNVIIRTNGRTALHWAVEKEMSAVIDVLIKAGARTDIADKNGRTAIDLAKGKPHVLKLLRPEAERAVPAAAPTGNDSEGWSLAGRTRVAHHGTYPDIGRKITEIFNFESRERTVIAENLKTGAETLTAPESFDTIAEDALRKAFAEFKRLGGEAEEGFVMGGKGKKGFRL